MGTTLLSNKMGSIEPGPLSIFPNCVGADTEDVLSLDVDGGYAEFAVGDVVTEGEIQILVDGGSEEFVVGDVVTDDEAGAGTGTIAAIILKSGVWDVGTASGTAVLILTGVTGTFTNDAGITGATAGVAVGNGTGTAANGGTGTVLQILSSTGNWNTDTHDGAATLVLGDVTGTFTNDAYLSKNGGGGGLALNDGTGTAGVIENDPTDVKGKGVVSVVASDTVDEVGRFTITLTDTHPGLLAVKSCILSEATADDWEVVLVSEAVATSKTIVIQVFKGGSAAPLEVTEKLFLELVLATSKMVPISY